MTVGNSNRKSSRVKRTAQKFDRTSLYPPELYVDLDEVECDCDDVYGGCECEPPASFRAFSTEDLKHTSGTRLLALYKLVKVVRVKSEFVLTDYEVKKKKPGSSG